MTTHTDTLQQATAEFGAAECHPEVEVSRVLEREVEITRTARRPSWATVGPRVAGGERHEARAASGGDRR